MFKGRAIIPIPLRKRVLAALHSAHQGATSMQLRAERSVFWPSQSQMPPTTPIIPEYSFQHVVMDYMELNGQTYGVFADRYSNWVGVHVGNG